MSLDPVTKTLFDSALTFTRIGLSAAGSAIGYAAEVLKDVEHELKSAGERVQAASPATDTPAAEAPATETRAAEHQPDPTASTK